MPPYHPVIVIVISKTQRRQKNKNPVAYWSERTADYNHPHTPPGSQSDDGTRNKLITMLETILRVALIVALVCRGMSLTFAPAFITRHSSDDLMSILEPVHHPINYRRAYHLRYEPSDKMREAPTNTQVMDVHDELIDVTEVPSSTEEPAPTVVEDSVIEDAHVEGAAASSEISSSIMKPDEPTTAKTVQLIGEGLKNLLYGSASDATIFRGPHGKGKGFLSLFEVFQFENSKCSVTISDIRTLHGVCYHEFECKSLGGVAMGACASGVGVCCVFIYGCGAVTSQPLAYFESPGYPAPVREPLICVLIVTLRPNVRQVRLDFLMFELNRPTDGDCLQDQFIVSGQNMNFVVPILCGINTGQHVYIDVDNAIEHKLFLSVFAKDIHPRSFNIKITQLERDFAPDGCLQYHTEPQGIVKSFNYDQAGTIVDAGEVTYFNNLNYAICIKRGKQMCSLVYSNEGNGELFDFQIVNKDEEENDVVPDGQAGVGIFDCPTDYIAINQLRLCGERLNDGSEIEDFTLNANIRDLFAGPIVLPVRTDGAYVGRGFLLMYKQELCI